jgi:hypothetical protein
MVVVLTADEFLRMGLARIGFSPDRQESVSRAVNLKRFRAHYGSNPLVYAQIWEDLQTTMIPEARIDARTTKPDYFLMAINFLARYPTEQEQASRFNICDKTARSWSWFFTRKIQALKVQKVSLPTALFSWTI